MNQNTKKICLCVLSCRVNFLAEKCLDSVKPYLYNVDTFVVHDRKSKEHAQKFCGHFSYQHIFTQCSCHSKLLNEICFYSQFFYDLMQRYDWIMFLDHDVIISNHESFWQQVDAELSKSSSSTWLLSSTFHWNYQDKTAREWFITIPWFIVNRKELYQLKDEPFIRNIGWSPKYDLRTEEAKNFYNMIREKPDMPIFHDTGTMLHWFLVDTYSAEAHRSIHLTKYFHVGGSWYYTTGAHYSTTTWVKNSTNNVIQLINDQTFVFSCQEDKDIVTNSDTIQAGLKALNLTLSIKDEISNRFMSLDAPVQLLFPSFILLS